MEEPLLGSKGKAKSIKTQSVPKLPGATSESIYTMVSRGIHQPQSPRIYKLGHLNEDGCFSF